MGFNGGLMVVYWWFNGDLMVSCSDGFLLRRLELTHPGDILPGFSRPGGWIRWIPGIPKQLAGFGAITLFESLKSDSMAEVHPRNQGLELQKGLQPMLIQQKTGFFNKNDWLVSSNGDYHPPSGDKMGIL